MKPFSPSGWKSSVYQVNSIELGAGASGGRFRLVASHGAHAFEWPGAGLTGPYHAIFRADVRYFATRHRTGRQSSACPLLACP